MKIIKINNKNIKLQIWDTAGQESFRSIIRCYYRNSMGAILVYDISNINSFNNIKFWLEEINNYTNSNISIILVGNKSDLNDNERKITYEEGLDLANKYNLIFYESSAKSIYNIDNIFFSLANDIIIKNISNIPIYNQNNNLNLINEYNNKCCHS
jgi:small GTP-binding protein